MSRTMKIASIVFILAIAPNTFGFSRFATVDHWDTGQLSKAGITIQPWKNEWMGEDPPLEWVKISFDCSRIAKDRDVLMTASFPHENTALVNAFRTQRRDHTGDVLTLILAMGDQGNAHGSLTIAIDEKTQDGGRDPFGYTMSMDRVMKLARAQKSN